MITRYAFVTNRPVSPAANESGIFCFLLLGFLRIRSLEYWSNGDGVMENRRCAVLLDNQMIEHNNLRIDPASSVFSWIPAFAGMTAFGYLIAGVIFTLGGEGFVNWSPVYSTDESPWKRFSGTRYLRCQKS